MEYSCNIPVQVISSCTTRGDFTPIRIRYENLNCELITVDILSVESRKCRHGTYNDLNYVCKGHVDNIIKFYHLRYSISSHRWTITKIKN